jgi:hypothetical protein
MANHTIHSTIAATNGNLTLGKRVEMEKEQKRSLQVAKCYITVVYQSPRYLPAHYQFKRPCAGYESKPYSQHVPTYFRIDVRHALRKDKKQNVFYTGIGYTEFGWV